jgi:hypothetical protein
MARTIEVPDDVIFKKVGDEIVLLDLQSGIYYGLDAVGSQLWLLLDETRDVEAAIERMLIEYDVDRETLTVDCDLLLRELEGKGLVRVIPT